MRISPASSFSFSIALLSCSKTYWTKAPIHKPSGPEGPIVQDRRFRDLKVPAPSSSETCQFRNLPVQKLAGSKTCRLKACCKNGAQFGAQAVVFRSARHARAVGV